MYPLLQNWKTLKTASDSDSSHVTKCVVNLMTFNSKH